MAQSLKNGIDALLFLASKKSVGVTELAEALGVHKSTAFRILDTFLDANMVQKNPETSKYRLGPAILRLSEQYYNYFGIVALAKPIMTRLASEIRESVHLCVLDNNSAVVIEQALSASRLVVNAKIGNSEPLHCSSVGKCMLSFVPEPVRETIIADITFEQFTENTIQDEQALREELARIRQRGYAIDDEELSEGIRCVAVPMFNERGACVYSLGVSGVVSRMTQEKLDKIVPLMQRAVNDMVVPAV